jgi:adenosylmethionine-8-amino-7-oxononanoate aminotransferase
MQENKEKDENSVTSVDQYASIATVYSLFSQGDLNNYVTTQFNRLSYVHVKFIVTVFSHMV